MYFRYFMWNFVGRESDIEGAGWLSPFSPGRDELPFELATNKGRNNFFMLPFILGLPAFLFITAATKRFPGCYYALLPYRYSLNFIP
jgi:hypothetical protein